VCCSVVAVLLQHVAASYIISTYIQAIDMLLLFYTGCVAVVLQCIAGLLQCVAVYCMISVYTGD